MTSNKAERALREPVVQRKISSLWNVWNEKGIMIKETIMSVLVTKRLQIIIYFKYITNLKAFLTCKWYHEKGIFTAIWDIIPNYPFFLL